MWAGSLALCIKTEIITKINENANDQIKLVGNRKVDAGGMRSFVDFLCKNICRHDGLISDY